MLDEDLRKAAMQALRIPRELPLELASRHGWHASAAQFYGHIRAVAQQAGFVPQEAPPPASGTVPLRAFGSGRGAEGRVRRQHQPA